MKKDEYKFSRGCYIAWEAFEYFITLLTTNAFLAKLTTELGFSDSLTAILSAFVALGCCFQLFTIAVFKGGPVKRRIIGLQLLSQSMFMLIYLVPFLRVGKGLKTVLFVLFLMGGFCFRNIVAAPKTNWFMSLVEDKKRGIFTSIKEMFSLVGGMAFNLIMGAVIDSYEAAGNTRMAFVVCAITIFMLMVLHTITLILSKEKETPHVASNKGILERFRIVFTDKDIMKVIAVSLFWTISSHIATSFYGTYQVKELGFSMKFVALLGILYAVARVPSSFILGKYADKHSFAKMLQICYGLAAASFLVATFTVPSNGKVFFTLHYMLFAASYGGINSAEINLIFDYASPEKRSDALAVKQTVFGIAGFVSTLVFTPLLTYIQNNGNRFLGLHVYGQQVLSFIAFACTVLLMIYMHKVVLKVKTINHD